MYKRQGWNEEWSFKLLTGFKNWLWIEDDSEGNLMIAAKSNDGASRSAYLMVFPNLVYAEVENDFENKVFSKEGIVGEYSNYIGALIEQDAFVATSGLSIMDSYTFRPLYDLSLIHI